MKSRDILLIAEIGLAAYYLLMGKKKPLKKEDMPAGKGGSDAPVFKGGSLPTYQSRPTTPVTVDDLSKKVKPAFVKTDYVMPDIVKPAYKEPIQMPALNLVPNIYDRGVNQPLPNKDAYYASFAGQCSEDMQTACACASARKEKFSIDIPKLP
jgi:hypothetical protein